MNKKEKRIKKKSYRKMSKIRRKNKKRILRGKVVCLNQQKNKKQKKKRLILYSKQVMIMKQSRNYNKNYKGLK